MLSTLKNIGFWFCLAMTFVTVTSCIFDDEDDLDIGQPTMLAKFVISVGNEKGGYPYITKQTTAVTQAQSTPVFRGMQDIAMIPFRLGSGVNAVTNANNRLGINITLPAAGSIPATPADNSIASLNVTSQSQVYQDVTIIQGTNAFLCYGKAIGDDNAANGRLDCATLENFNVADISFKPKAIYTPADPDTPTPPTEATALAQYITDIANTTGWATSTNVKMRLLHESFVSQHAGSATNVLATLQKLYDAILIETGTMRDNIIASMKIGSTENDVLHLTNDKLEWNDNVTFKDYPASIGLLDGAAGLPDGAAYIRWDDTDPTATHFAPVINGTYDNVDNRPQGTDPETFALGTGVDLMHYATPAPLYYRSNTRINVSNSTQLDNTRVTTLDWSQILDVYEYEEGEVTYNTKSIALIDPMQYAVARMDAAIVVDASTIVAGKSTLLDKDDVGTDAADLELTGVLIGGQYDVDFEFTPTTASGAKPYIIYDNNINPASTATNPPTPITLASNIGKTSNYIVNHTLVLPSREDENVNIYLEFKNNSDHDISTLTGLVPPGCKLYLAGTITLETGQHYVFEQDKYTTFTATIRDLKNACNVVPSMDVGLTFTVQVAIKEWEEISTENHDLYNW